jgi:hypothetical protein
VREKLTLAVLTRHFAGLLGSMIDVEYSAEPSSFIAGQKQAHADVAILPAHLYKSLDDVAEDVLMPCAFKLAEILKNERATTIFEMNMPPPSYMAETSIQKFGEVSVRGMVLREREFPSPNEGDPPIVVDLFRFDVLYREDSLQ